MKKSKLNSISIASLCFVASLCSETQGMDNRSDILESSTANSNLIMQLSARYESDEGPSMSDSVSSDLEKLKHTQKSWASYFLPPAKYFIHATSDVISYAKAHPVYSMIFMGLLFTGESTIVSALGWPSGECVSRCQTEFGMGWKDVLGNPIVVKGGELAYCLGKCASEKV